MPRLNMYKALTEAGIEVDKVTFTLLDEANQVRVADEALTNMMKFITDKYNSIDFGEIERTAGDYKKFKYIGMIDENLRMLRNVYESSPDEGAKKYLEVINSCFIVRDHLIANSSLYTTLYKQGNGLAQLMYTSLVAALIYAIGIMVSNTIRFVTSEKDAECEVLFDEIPGSIKHIHIKNIVAAANDINTFTKLLNEMAKPSTRNAMTESITAIAVAASIVGVIVFAPRIIYLIRNIIYSVYFSRVKIADMLNTQADLVRANIESLEGRRGDKKIIARQKRIVDKLEKWKNRIAIKVDSVEALKNQQVRKEDASLKIDKNSPNIMYPNPETSGAGLLI